MSGLKATPGPWEHDADDDTILAHGSSAVARVYQAHDFPCLDDGEQAGIEDECLANAHLIASAPDLFEALEGFVKQWNACGPNSDFGRYFKTVRDQAVAALARARGEAA